MKSQAAEEAKIGRRGVTIIAIWLSVSRYHFQEYIECVILSPKWQPVVDWDIYRDLCHLVSLGTRKEFDFAGDKDLECIVVTGRRRQCIWGVLETRREFLKDLARTHLAPVHKPWRENSKAFRSHGLYHLTVALLRAESETATDYSLGP